MLVVSHIRVYEKEPSCVASELQRSPSSSSCSSASHHHLRGWWRGGGWFGWGRCLSRCSLRSFDTAEETLGLEGPLLAPGCRPKPPISRRVHPPPPVSPRKHTAQKTEYRSNCICGPVRSEWELLSSAFKQRGSNLISGQLYSESKFRLKTVGCVSDLPNFMNRMQTPNVP